MGCDPAQAGCEVADARHRRGWNAVPPAFRQRRRSGRGVLVAPGDWIVSAGSDRDGEGLFKIPVDGSVPVRLAKGAFLDPVWSPRGDLIVYGGTQVFTSMPLLGVHPDGTPAELPEINVRREGERARFLPDGTGLIYTQGRISAGQDFWLLDLFNDAVAKFDPFD
jgi:hypothetical protein